MIAIAIDDEPIALDVVRAHATMVPFIELRDVFTNAFEALSYLQKNKVDLIFPYKMPDISRLDKDHSPAYLILEKHLQSLTDINIFIIRLISCKNANL